MDGTELSFGIVILVQISIGISVNVLLLLFYAHVVSASHKPSSPDLILAHLTLANTIILLTSGIPETMSAWGLRNFLDTVGCKILMYLYRVGRGLAICTTCLLSVFQAVTVSPGTSRWAGVKAKLPKCVVPFCLLSWILNLVIDVTTPLYTTGLQNTSTVHVILDLKYCSRISTRADINLIISVALSLRDLFFMVLMSTASGYMVLVLQRHHRRVQHLHGPGRSPRARPEVRAAKRVIALVTLYILHYGRQRIMLSILVNVKENSPLLMNSHMLLGYTFSSITPFLIITSDKRMRTFWEKESSDSSMDSQSGAGKPSTFPLSPPGIR